MSSTSTKVSIKQVRVLIVDDHPALCEGLGHRIDAQDDMTVCGQAADVQEALGQIRELHPDVVIVDIALKNSDGLELLKTLKAHHKQIRTLVHSMYEESLYADRCLHAGAMGYVNKEADANDVIRAIRAIRDNRVYLSSAMTETMLGRTTRGSQPRTDPIETLSDRQLEIFRLVGEGLAAQQIANRLGISVHTVESHRENIKRKLDVNSLTQLTRRAVLWVEDQR